MSARDEPLFQMQEAAKDLAQRNDALTAELAAVSESLRVYRAQVEGAHQVHLARERAMAEQEDTLNRTKDAAARTNAANLRLQEEHAETKRVFSEWVQALGLMTTLYPALEVDTTDPLGMAHRVMHHVLLERAQHRQLNDPPPGIVSIKLACGDLRSEHLIPAVLVLAAMNPERMVSEALSDEITKLIQEAMASPEQAGAQRRKPQ